MEPLTPGTVALVAAPVALTPAALTATTGRRLRAVVLDRPDGH
jgi:hypothetical protein